MMNSVETIFFIEVLTCSNRTLSLCKSHPVKNIITYCANGALLKVLGRNVARLFTDAFILIGRSIKINCIVF